MRRFAMLIGILAVCAAAIAALVAGRAGAQDATLASRMSGAAETLVLVEHNDNIFKLDAGPTGPSAGDWQVWGPNPLYDEADGADTGATTQGTCFNLPFGADCYANETIVFADGSTLEIQGVEGGGNKASMRTIVGGSGRYLGASGTLTAAPTSDQTVWTKTIEIITPSQP